MATTGGDKNLNPTKLIDEFIKEINKLNVMSSKAWKEKQAFWERFEKILTNPNFLANLEGDLKLFLGTMNIKIDQHQGKRLLGLVPGVVAVLQKGADQKYTTIKQKIKDAQKEAGEKIQELDIQKLGIGTEKLKDLRQKRAAKENSEGGKAAMAALKAMMKETPASWRGKINKTPSESGADKEEEETVQINERAVKQLIKEIDGLKKLVPQGHSDSFAQARFELLAIISEVAGDKKKFKNERINMSLELFFDRLEIPGNSAKVMAHCKRLVEEIDFDREYNKERQKELDSLKSKFYELYHDKNNTEEPNDTIKAYANIFTNFVQLILKNLRSFRAEYQKEREARKQPKQRPEREKQLKRIEKCVEELRNQSEMLLKIGAKDEEIRRGPLSGVTINPPEVLSEIRTGILAGMQVKGVQNTAFIKKYLELIKELNAIRIEISKESNTTPSTLEEACINKLKILLSPAMKMQIEELRELYSHGGTYVPKELFQDIYDVLALDVDKMKVTQPKSVFARFRSPTKREAATPMPAMGNFLLIEKARKMELKEVVFQVKSEPRQVVLGARRGELLQSLIDVGSQHGVRFETDDFTTEYNQNLIKAGSPKQSEERREQVRKIKEAINEVSLCLDVLKKDDKNEKPARKALPKSSDTVNQLIAEAERMGNKELKLDRAAFLLSNYLANLLAVLYQTQKEIGSEKYTKDGHALQEVCIQYLKDIVKNPAVIKGMQEALQSSNCTELEAQVFRTFVGKPGAKPAIDVDLLEVTEAPKAKAKRGK